MIVGDYRHWRKEQKKKLRKKLELKTLISDSGRIYSLPELWRMRFKKDFMAIRPGGWGDAKRYLFEDLLVYAAIAALVVLGDLFLNLAHAVGLRSTPHVYHLGFYQLAVLAFAGIQFVRKWLDWTYYK